jgi:flagellar basal body rod protein FlgG
MKKIFTIIICSLVFTHFGQFDVKWSELMPVKGRVAQVLPISYSDFYTTRFQGGAFLGSTFLTKHSNFAVTSKGKITAKLEKGYGQVESICVIKENPIIFISDKKDGENTLYFQKYANTCDPAGLPVEIASYKMPKGWKRKGAFWVHQSENKDFFVVDYEISGNKEEKDKFGYVVYSSDFEVVSEGEYELPYEANKVDITNNYLSNTGDYFLAAKVYKANDSKKIFKSRLNLDKIVVMHVTPEGVEEFDLDLKGGKFISDLTFSSDQNRKLTFTGLYSDKGYNGVKGIFYFQLDFNKKIMMNEGWEQFSTDFITSDWSDRAKKKAAKGKGEPELYEYDIRNIQTLKDGSMVGMLEQFFIRAVTTTDSRGNSRTTYYYYYNDVIVYKINNSGGFEWVKKIKKYQVSTNDGGFYSSVASFHTDDKLVILFNDNLKNYSESGNFIDDNNRFYPTSYRKKTNCVAKVEVDLASGDIERSTYFDRKETKAFAVPKKFCVDYNKKEMLMVLLYGKKEKYGVLSF